VAHKFPAPAADAAVGGAASTQPKRTSQLKTASTTEQATTGRTTKDKTNSQDTPRHHNKINDNQAEPRPPDQANKQI
jgi:hypothetical protein